MFPLQYFLGVLHFFSDKEHYFTSLKHLAVIDLFPFSWCGLLYLCMCVEELKQCHCQWLHSYMAILVLLQVVGHGLPLCLCQ